MYKRILKSIKAIFNSKKSKFLFPLFALNRYDFSNYFAIELAYKLNQRLKLFHYKKNKQLNLKLKNNCFYIIFQEKEYKVKVRVVDSLFSFHYPIAGSLFIPNNTNKKLYTIEEFLKDNFSVEKDTIELFLIYPLPLAINKWIYSDRVYNFILDKGYISKRFRLRGFSILVILKV